MRQADFIKQDLGMIYSVNKPKGILLSYMFMLEQRHHWSFGGENLKDELDGQMKLHFKNYWKFGFDLDRAYNEIDTRELRGGPSLRIDANTSTGFLFQTDNSRDVMLAGMVDFTNFDDKITWKNTYDFTIRWLVSNSFTLSSKTGYSAEIDNSQYIFQKNINDDKEYVVGRIDRNTLYTTFRAEYFITPELSLQYYGSPYASTGKFLDYRKVEDSKSWDLDDRYSFLKVVENDQGKFLYDDDNNLYYDFEDGNFDFNYQEFQSNFVARWEYKTGSTIYFVWTNTRFTYDDVHNPSIINSFKDIMKVKAQNAFMIKVSYWFSL